MGLQAFPGEITWIGSFILLPGMLMIIIGQSQADPSQINNNESSSDGTKKPLAYELFLVEQEALDNESANKNLKSIRGK